MATNDNGISSTSADSTILDDDDLFSEDETIELNAKNEASSQNSADDLDANKIKPEQKASNKENDNDALPNKKTGLIPKVIIGLSLVFVALYIFGMVAEPSSKSNPSTVNVNEKSKAAPGERDTAQLNNTESVLAEFERERNNNSSVVIRASEQDDTQAVRSEVKVQVDEQPLPSSTESIANDESAAISNKILEKIANLTKDIEATNSRLDDLAIKVDELNAAPTGSAIRQEEINLLTTFKAEQSEQNKIYSKALGDIKRSLLLLKKSPSKQVAKKDDIPKIEVVMSVEGRGVFVTEEGKEITLEKGDNLKGFGRVIHVDVGGCIYGRYDKKHKAIGATCI
jgi:hypothetical protein